LNATAPTSKYDLALGEDPQRNNDFTYANDPDGKRLPLGCHIPRMYPRDTNMYQLTDVNVHHKAQHDLWRASRSERHLRTRR
jgi:deferrochelatase/peroxidase EfeB